MRTFLTTLLLSASVVSCNSTCCENSAVLPSPHSVATDTTYEDCVRAQRRLQALRCAKDGIPLWQAPGTAGAPNATREWVEACEYSATQGRDWEPKKIAEYEDCDQEFLK